MTARVHFTASEAEIAQKALRVLTDRYGTVPLDQAQVVVALGGDGFMLQTLHALTDRDLPVYGMNRGTVGFLMNGYSEGSLPERL
ncbi:NAD(+)/NADH kinase, partial [Paracoccus sp. (in: a-proteobacteria)]